MPKYQVTGPDGATYEVEAPEGASEQDVMAYVQSNAGKEKSAPPASRGPLGAVDDTMRSLASGMTFGFGDEIAAGLGAATGIGGKFGDYRGNLQEQRKRDDDVMSRMPITSMVAKMIGGVASPIAKGISASVGMARAPGYLNYAMQGAAGGALAGAGESTEGNRMAGAGTGAAFGAALGAALPAAATGIAAAGRGIANRFSAPATQAGRRLETAFIRDGMNFDDGMATLRGLGDDAAIADLGGNVRGLAEAAAQTPGKSLKAAEALTERQFGQGERLLNDALKITGVDSAEALIKQRSEAARPWYQAAFSQDNYRTIRSEPIKRLMTRPDFQKGMRAGIKDILDEAAVTGEDLRAFNTYFDGADLNDPNLVITKEPTLRVLDAAKRGFDKILNSDDYLNANGTKKQEWYRMDDMRKLLLREIDDKLGDTVEGKAYKKAREEWGGPSDVINGLRLIEKTIEGARDGSDITGRLYGSPGARKKLDTLFKNVPEGAKAFRDSVNRERTFAQTNRAVSGNSRTAYRNAAQDDMAGDPVDAAFNVAQNPTLANAGGQVLNVARNWLRRPPTEVADELAPMFSTDPATRDAAMAALQTRMGGQTLLDRAMRPLPKSGNLLRGAAIAGGYSGGQFGSNR